MGASRTEGTDEPVFTYAALVNENSPKSLSVCAPVSFSGKASFDAISIALVADGTAAIGPRPLRWASSRVTEPFSRDDDRAFAT